MGNIKITQELFIILVKYFLVGQEELFPEIAKALEEKMDAMIRRELYTRYKTAPSPEEQESARKDYLDKRGIPGDFRW